MGEQFALERFRWRDLGPLAHGGQAELRRVHLVENINCLGVLKRLPGSVSADSYRYRLMHREPLIQQHLRDSGIPDVYDKGNTEWGSPCFVQEYIKGITLDDAIKNGVAKDVAVTMIVNGALILERVHRAGVIHRDITPRNMLWSRKGQMYLIDFGIALWFHCPDPKDYAQPYGTPGYTAPEVARCLWTPQTDIYGLGAVSYKLLTGKPASAAPPSTVRPGLSSNLDAVIMRCLQERPEDRFASAGEVAQALGCETHAAEACPMCLKPRTDNYCGRCGYSFLERTACIAEGALLVENGPCAKTPILLDGLPVVKLGRREINPEDAAISREHLVLERVGEGWAMVVVGRNGAWLNAQPIRLKTLLFAGDQLLCGSTRMLYVGKP